MLRALFLGAGLFVLALGLECLAIDSATLSNLSEEGPTVITFMPQEWVPWSLISAGLVTLLYSFTLPNKFKSG